MRTRIVNETVNVAVDAPLSPRRKALRIILVVFTLAAVAGGLWWWLVASKHETTTDAYVAGDQVTVSALVSGTVVKLTTEDTASVQAGDVLVEFDGSDAEVALARAAAQLTQALRQARQQGATAAQFDAEVQERQIELRQAEQRLERRLPLLTDQAVAAEDVTQAETSVSLARAALVRSQQQAAAAHALVGGTPPARQPAVMEARAAYEQAWLTAHRNRVLAPVAGQVARRNVQLGQRVQAGQTLMVIVPLKSVWVDANFKEPQLRRMHPGQAATVTADVYGGSVKYHGVVAGVAAGTGSAFSLLPAQNASGNWVKVVQRVPVRIQLDAAEVAAHPLRIGMSTYVAVDTRLQDAQALLARAPVTSGARTALYDDGRRAAAAAAEAVLASQVPAAP
jgi:membrane fusion protein (multidrug efflux system)